MIQQATINPLIQIENSFTLGFINQEPDFFTTPAEERNDQNSVYLLPQNLINLIEEEYILKEPEEIKRFLIDNEDLIEILFSATEHIHEIFGDVPIYLELHHDPEEEWDELVIIVKSNYPPEKAVELEDKLFEDWFVKVLDKGKGRLNFTEEPL